MASRSRPSLDAPANAALLAYLATRAGAREDPPGVRWPDEVEQPYLSLGCHPDVVERLWQTINGALPADCRAVVHYTPVLLHPTTGVIFAFGLGTSYAIRVPPSLMAQATERGLQPIHVFAQNRELDLRPFGAGWLFGKWLREEVGWCLAEYDAAGTELR